MPDRTGADEPLVLREPTSWGVRLTLNRPAKLNAISTELRDELAAAIRAAEDDEAVRVIAIAGAGRAFCAGYDLEEESGATTSGRGARCSPGTWRRRWPSGAARSR